MLLFVFQQFETFKVNDLKFLDFFSQDFLTQTQDMYLATTIIVRGDFQENRSRTDPFESFTNLCLIYILNSFWGLGESRR